MAIAAAATKLGVHVSKPLAEHARYDLIFDISGQLLRVQCKWGSRRGGVIAVNVAGFRYTADGYVRSRYTAEEIDPWASIARPSIAATCSRLSSSPARGVCICAWNLP